MTMDRDERAREPRTPPPAAGRTPGVPPATDARPRETNAAGGGQDDARATVERGQEKAKEYSERAQEKAGELGHAAQEQAEAGREETAGGMAQAAEQLRERTEGAGGVREQVGVTAAEGLEKTSGYLREHNTSQIMDDLEAYVREHPTQALVGAVAAGFILGRILR